MSGITNGGPGRGPRNSPPATDCSPPRGRTSRGSLHQMNNSKAMAMYVNSYPRHRNTKEGDDHRLWAKPAAVWDADRANRD